MHRRAFPNRFDFWLMAWIDGQPKRAFAAKASGLGAGIMVDALGCARAASESDPARLMMGDTKAVEAGAAMLQQSTRFYSHAASVVMRSPGILADCGVQLR